MNEIASHDLRYLQRMNERVTDPKLCQCPNCWQANGDIPTMTEEETYRLELMIRQAAVIALALAHTALTPRARQTVLMDRIRAVCLYSYMFGVDNARGETND